MGLFDSLRRVVRPKTEPGKAPATPPSKPAVEDTPAQEAATPKLQESAAPKTATSNTAQLTRPSTDGKLPAVESNPPVVDPVPTSFLTRPAEKTTPNPRRVLFVGADPTWYQRVEGQMVELQPDWLCWKTENTSEAETLLSSGTFDSLVLDSQTSQASEFLNQTERKFGRAICLVRCDLSDRPAVAQWNRLGATPVSADGEAAALVTSLRRAERLREWMAIPPLMKLLPQIRKLPAKPKLYTQVTEELESPNGSMAVVARYISQDPVMAAKMLQMANSAFFGSIHEVTDISEAVMMLGTERVRSLILMAGVFSQYDNLKCNGFSLELIWDHSLWVGLLSRTIALGETRNVKMADMAFTAGLFHDIGKLILAGNVPDLYEAVRRKQKEASLSQRDAELAVMGTTHAELGACLLATWGLPLPILEAMAWHHEPQRSEDRGFSLLAAVHVANVFAQENGHGTNEAVREDINAKFLEQIGMGDCRARWEGFCGIGTKRNASAPDENK
jgi:putative nucleotidyltransferase with HDIG domain